jgi:hypothetical protein
MNTHNIVQTADRLNRIARNIRWMTLSGDRDKAKSVAWQAITCEHIRLELTAARRAIAEIAAELKAAGAP